MRAIRTVARSFRALIATKLGACAFCIRLSLLLSVSSWAVFVVSSFLFPGSLTAKLALALALGFTTLFASHLAAYAVRVVLGYRKAGRVTPGETSASTPNRRRFLVLSARTIGLALVPTVLVSALWGSASADPNCPPPPACTSLCCCNGCKTTIKKCHPMYAWCAIYCRAQSQCLGPLP